MSMWMAREKGRMGIDLSSMNQCVTWSFGIHRSAAELVNCLVPQSLVLVLVPCSKLRY